MDHGTAAQLLLELSLRSPVPQPDVSKDLGLDDVRAVAGSFALLPDTRPMGGGYLGRVCLAWQPWSAFELDVVGGNQRNKKTALAKTGAYVTVPCPIRCHCWCNS